MPTDSMTRPVILASSSIFRRSLLERLRINFEIDSPDIDESLTEEETPLNYVRRLSLAKAQTVASRQHDSLIIASDQCSVLEGVISGKPKNHPTAVQQLQRSSGNIVSFLTGLCVLDSATGDYILDAIPFHVHFRTLSEDEIERYITLEQPFECAGSFKAEGLGITLFNRLEGDDPTALIGLPLIRLIEMLRQFGLKLP